MSPTQEAMHPCGNLHRIPYWRSRGAYHNVAKTTCARLVSGAVPQPYLL